MLGCPVDADAPGLWSDPQPPRVKPVQWLQPEQAFVVRLPNGGGRQGLRRRCPVFHSWLSAQHNAGTLTRQELVSMVSTHTDATEDSSDHVNHARRPSLPPAPGRF